MGDMIDRQALRLMKTEECAGHTIEYAMGWKACIEWIKKLPSAQPEVKPIDYRDCSCALLKMWIENVLTDSEYSRIQGKLNSSDFAKEGLRIPVPYQEEQNG